MCSDFLGFEEGMNKKEFLKGKCHQLLFGWECCGCWYKFAHVVELFIMDAFVDMFITLCIVVNTFFMAMEQDGMDHHLQTTLSYGNYVSSAEFSYHSVLVQSSYNELVKPLCLKHRPQALVERQQDDNINVSE